MNANEDRRCDADEGLFVSVGLLLLLFSPVLPEYVRTRTGWDTGLEVRCPLLDGLFVVVLMVCRRARGQGLG